MGIISDLVNMKAAQDAKAKQGPLDVARLVLSDENATPEAREWATNSVVSLLSDTFGGKGKGGRSSGGGGGGAGGGGKDGGLGGFFKTLLGGISQNPYTASKGVKEKVSEIGAGRPKRFELTEEEKQAAKDRATAAADKEKLEYEQKLQGQKDQAKFEADQKQEAENRRVQLIYDNEDYDRWTERGSKLGLTGRDLAEFAATKGQKMPTQASAGTPRVLYGKVKGQEDQGLQILTFNPRNPGAGFVDASGREYTKDEISDISNSPPAAQRLYGRPLEISQYVQSKGYKIGSPEYNYYFGQIAGADLQTSLGRTQQLGAIDTAQSGIGLGQGFPAIPQNPNPQEGAGGNQAPAAGPAQTGQPGPTSTTPGLGTGRPPALPPFNQVAPGQQGAATTPKQPLAPKAAATSTNPNDRFVSMYLSSLFSDAPVTGGAAKVGIIKGREALQKVTGLSPIDFSLIEASSKDNRTAMAQTIQRAVATSRVNEVLNEFGDETMKRAASALNTGSPFLNKHVRDIDVAAVGNPDLKRFLTALNGFQRQYGILTSGSPQSIAQLPVAVRNDVERIIDPNATLAEVIATVDQVKIEGKRETQGFKNSIQDTMSQISSGLGGNKSGKTSGGEDKEYNGHTYHRDKPGDEWRLVK